MRSNGKGAIGFFVADIDTQDAANKSLFGQKVI